MFRKKKKMEVNPFDRKINKMIYQLGTFRCVLTSNVDDCIIKKGVINLYPEGADKIAAQKDFEKAQQKLICAIAQYDDMLSQITCFAQNHRTEFSHSVPILASSHAVIENQYRSFWRR